MTIIDIVKSDNLDAFLDLNLASFDAVITDPPYASGGMTTASRKNTTTKKYQLGGTLKTYPDFDNDNRDQRSHFLWSIEWMRRALSVTRPGGWLIIFSDWRQLPLTSDALQVAGWEWQGIVPWDKTEACRPSPGMFRNQSEYALIATRGKRDSSHLVYPAGVFRTRLNPNKKLHLTAKPVDLMEHLMSVLRPGSKVLDPFMGSGTTLIAAINRGHDATGIELSGAYYDITKTRLSGLPIAHSLQEPCNDRATYVFDPVSTTIPDPKIAVA